MQKILTIDSIFTALFSTIGYGLGYFFPIYNGLNIFLSLLICMIIGTVFDMIVNSIVFSKYIQEKNIRRYLCFLAITIIFVCVGLFVFKRYSHSIIDDAGLQFSFVIIIPLIAFVVSFIKQYLKKVKIKNKYGTGEEGFKFSDKDFLNIESLNNRNKEIIGEYDKNIAVKTKYGTYVGKKHLNRVSYLGIPYAKPPVGSLRFLKPEELDPSDKIYEAYYYGPSEIQPDNAHNLLNKHLQSEDCLYFNLYKTNNNTTNKPVLIYFHGGDGRYGGCVNPLYNIDNLSKKYNDAILINFNYRIGVFSISDFSERIKDDKLSDSNCLSLLDQLLFLNYIKENISLFGGNPNNITLIGDSSGASYINALCLLKQAKGLFKRVFIIVGSIYDFPTNTNNAKTIGNIIVDKFNAHSLNDLQTISSEDLRQITKDYYANIDLAPRGSKYIDVNLEQMLESGACKDIEYIFGIASDDISVWKAMLSGEHEINSLVNSYYSSLRKIIGEEKGLLLDKIKDIYAKESADDIEARLKLLADFQYKSAILKNCSLLIKGGSKVRVFYWDVSSNVEKLSSNTVSIVATILDNKEIAESMGYINSPVVTTIMDTLLHKYICGEELELFSNEIKGVNKLSWPYYEKDNGTVLYIDDKNIDVRENVFSDLIISIKKLFD